MDEKITVLLVEDHEIVRKGLLALLEFEDNIIVVGEAGNGMIAVEMAQDLRPMVILMDIAMPVLNGLEASKQILKNHPETKIIILSAYADDNYIEKSMRIGARGFLVKQCSPNLLAQAIRDVNDGEYIFSKLIEDRLDQLNQEVISNNGIVKKKKHALSNRESQVLQLIAEGMSNKIIAHTLEISIKTVDKHRQNLMKKLYIHDTAGLTRYAIAEGIIENSSHAAKVI